MGLGVSYAEGRQVHRQETHARLGPRPFSTPCIIFTARLIRERFYPFPTQELYRDLFVPKRAR